MSYTKYIFCGVKKKSKKKKTEKAFKRSKIKCRWLFFLFIKPRDFNL